MLKYLDIFLFNYMRAKFYYNEYLFWQHSSFHLVSNIKFGFIIFKFKTVHLILHK